MLTEERKALILDILRRDGRLVAKDFSRDLGLSEDTIRRDLRELAADGRLQRVHGGALPASPATEDFDGRKAIGMEGKAAIGGAAARLISSGQVVFLDGGTSAVQLARQIPAGIAATVVTHSPSVAVELARHDAVEVELIGGRLFKHSVVAMGASAAEAIARIRADIYFMGVTGIHPETGLTTGHAEEAAIKRLIARQAAEVVVLASQEKLGAASPFAIAPLSEASTLVVERGLPDAMLRPFREAGIAIVEA